MNRASHLWLLSTAFLLASCTPSGGLSGFSPVTHELSDRVADRFSGQRAFDTVAFMDQFVRWPGNRGFDASIHHIAAELGSAGFVLEDGSGTEGPLIYRIERYPMDTPAWEPLAASVQIVGGDEILNFETNRNMLARMSHSTPDGGVTAGLVDVGSRDDVPCTEVDGRIVLGNQSAGRLARRFAECDVVGTLGYSLPDYLLPEKNRHSIQFGSVSYSEQPGWAVSLSFDAQQRIRTALDAGSVSVRVETDVRWTPDADELTVVAEVRGQRAPEERFVFSAHVQEPGANDNASGVGAQLEMARVAAQMVQENEVEADRTITFLWGLEIRSTARYIEQDSVRADGIKWGLSLDMVGENTAITGGTFLIEKMPDPSAIWTRGDDKHSEWGGRPLTLEDMMPHYLNDYVLNRARETAQSTDWLVGSNPFEGGSDHVPFLRADIPGVLFWHFTDQFYHTDQDRIDKVSADELSNVGRTALVAALGLVTATDETASGILAEVRKAGLDRIDVEARLSLTEAASGKSAEIQRQIIEAWDNWYVDALTSLQDLEPLASIPADQMEEAIAELAAARDEAETAIQERFNRAIGEAAAARQDD
ncbi:MAG: aminopeptidase YwaD [Rhodothermales bacterium]|jgi:aminopeptidase YwaD